MPPRVSVILPVRDGARTLPAALASLAAQTFRDFEVVCVDDGSEDATADLLDGWKRDEPRLRVIRQPRLGLVAALNRGVGAARGEFIARMDADDVGHPDRLRLQVGRLHAEPDLGVMSCRVEFGGNRAAAAGYARYVDWINGLLTHEEIALARFRESPLAHPSVMFRRELPERHGGYRDGRFPEDYELWLRWMEAGVRFAKAPEVLLTWNDAPDRLSRTHPNYDVNAFYDMKAGYLAQWLAAHNPRHPRVVIIGAGRVTRRRVEKLIALGVEVEAWADLDPKKIGRAYHGAPVVHHEAIPPPDQCFVVPFVSSIGAADQIRGMLEGRGFVRGKTFIEAG
jgi:glycosyltransferase involved in cell wall biosynthesis